MKRVLHQIQLIIFKKCAHFITLNPPTSNHRVEIYIYLTDTIEEIYGNDNGEDLVHNMNITKVNSTKLPLSATSDGDGSLDNAGADVPGKSSVSS